MYIYIYVYIHIYDRSVHTADWVILKRYNLYKTEQAVPSSENGLYFPQLDSGEFLHTMTARRRNVYRKVFFFAKSDSWLDPHNKQPVPNS